MFLILSVSAVFLTYWLNHQDDQKLENQQNARRANFKILKDSLATFGLTFWVSLLAVALCETSEFLPLMNTNEVVFKNTLGFLLKVSALFLLFPFVFNLVKMCGELLIGKNWQTVLVNFIYNVMCEFGVFWAIVITAFYLS